MVAYSHKKPYVVMQQDETQQQSDMGGIYNKGYADVN